MESKIHSIVITSILAFALIAGIPTAFVSVLAQGEGGGPGGMTGGEGMPEDGGMTGGGEMPKDGGMTGGGEMPKDGGMTGDTGGTTDEP